jgi:hypothetical protein
MKHGLTAAAILSSVFVFEYGRGDEPSGTNQSIIANGARAKGSVSLEEARRQATILHTAMHAALQVVHHRYYREDEGLPIPAATLKDVFAELEQEEKVTLRWLAVDGQVMNSDHKARTPFETEAVAALKAGKKDFEREENGLFRRAGSITLTNHCLKCHMPDRKSTANRTAGLIIAIPIKQK